MRTIFIKGARNLMGEDTLVINRGTPKEKRYSCISGNAKCLELVGISNEPNVRAVDTHAAVLPKIENTLIEEPDMMPVRNNGITIIASYFEYNKKKGAWEIRLADGDGIINGGHTSYVINKMSKLGLLKDFVKVPIRVFESSKLNEDDIAEMSACLNYTCSPKLSTLLEKRGLTEGLKNALSNDFVDKIEWKENTREGKAGVDYITLDEFLMLLSLFNVVEYGYFNHDKSKVVTKSPKTVVERYSAEIYNFDYLYPIMDDILRLYEEVHVSLTRVASKTKGRGSVSRINLICGATERKMSYLNQLDSDNPIFKTVFTGKEYTYKLAAGFMYIILTAFRANITIEDDKVKWVIPDVVGLFRSIESDIWRTILENVTVSERENKKKIKYQYINVSDNTKTGTPIWNAVYNLVENKVFKEILKTK